MDSDGLPEGMGDAPRGVASGLAPWLISLLALLAGLAATAALATWQQRRAEVEDDRHLNALAESEYTALVSQMRAFELTLRSMQSGFLTTPISAEGFSRLYSNLQPARRLPGLQAVVYAERQPAADGERYVTTLVEPRAGNTRVLGLDVRSQPANLAALQASRDADQPMLSAPFRLIQDAPAHSPDGLLLRLPVYTPGPPPATLAERRARFAGSLAISFRISTLAARVFPVEWRRDLHLRVIDAGPGHALVFDSHRAAHAAPIRWQFQRPLDFGGRRWLVTVHDARHDRRSLGDTLPILIAGGTASLLLALWIASLANQRRRALQIGAAMSRRYRESEQRFRVVNELLPALVLLVREDTGRVSYANQAARVRLGARVDEATLDSLFEDPHRRAELQLPDTCWDSVEAMLHSTNGDRFWASVSIARVEIGGIAKKLMVATDISQQRQLTELLTYQASHDALTELLNRREFERRVERMLAHAALGGPTCALLYVDLDQFKLINDTSGHAAGDHLLTQLATLMREQLRTGDVLARLGGDEFGVLACDVHDEAGARLVAERLRQHIHGFTFVWERSSYGITASIGGVMVEPGTSSLKDLMAQADTGCYLAKEAGRNRVHFYSGQDDAAAHRRTEMEWAHRLRNALEQDRFRLYYQEVHPLAQLAGGTRLEILLRLLDEDGRIVPPGAFMPAAERYGLMPAIDRWVIQNTLANMDRLHPEGPGLRFVAINLSGASIEDDSLVEMILALMERHNVDPGRVCFEITETVAVRNLGEVSRFAGQLRKAGCHIALDDFGVGMSSFGYLKNLPVDIIKIDGSFVQDLLSDPMSHAIVRAVTDIGHNRGMSVIAEWVDSEELIRALAEIGVDHAQGYALHRPEPTVMHRVNAEVVPQT